jgi:hypothetical protein
MKLSEMNEQQRREYNKEKKRIQRAKQKQQKLAAIIPNARDYVIPEPSWDAVAQYARETEQAIRAELPGVTNRDIYIIRSVCSVLRGLECGYQQKVMNPTGVLVGGYFPDALGSEIVEYVHRYPDILGSPTFKSLYESVLREIVRWSKKNTDYITPELIADVEAEIDGIYTLPPAPQIPKAPAPAPEPVLNFDELLEQGRVQLLDRLGLLSPEAQRYLNGN